MCPRSVLRLLRTGHLDFHNTARAGQDDGHEQEAKERFEFLHVELEGRRWRVTGRLAGQPPPDGSSGSVQAGRAMLEWLISRRVGHRSGRPPSRRLTVMTAGGLLVLACALVFMFRLIEVPITLDLVGLVCRPTFGSSFIEN